jgi:putative ABC transport system ATP-binding protein
LNVLVVDNLIKKYRNKDKKVISKALNGINLEVEKGEFVGIMGPSGSGKTTLLNILSGIDKATSGSVKISGEDIFKMHKDDLALFRRKHLGFVFQEYNLLDSLSIRENIMLPMILEKRECNEIEKKVSQLTEMMGIGEIIQKYPYEVSGGQQQRAAVCRAIANDPDIVFADEPTGNLDSEASKNVMKYFEKLNIEKKSTLLIVTHDPFAASYCNRVIFIKDGIVSMEIKKKDSRHMFFDEILECVSKLGGCNDDF